MFTNDGVHAGPGDYESIFSQRGREYNLGMTRYPLARAKEFAVVVNALEVSPGDAILDAPSGGGYLGGFLPENLQHGLIELDPAKEFRQAAAPQAIAQGPAAGRNAIIAPLDAIPIQSAGCDAIASVAGLHHATDLGAIFTEFRRVLRADGSLVILEVDEGSSVDRFLNGFVNQHNSSGHCGEFIDDNFVKCLADCNFTVKQDAMACYTWDFDSCTAMVEFTRLIFGLDLADDATIREGIATTLGYEERKDGCFMNWELRLITAS